MITERFPVLVIVGWPAMSCVEQGLRGGAVPCDGLNLTVGATGNQERQPEAVDASGNRGPRDPAARTAEGEDYPPLQVWRLRLPHGATRLRAAAPQAVEATLGHVCFPGCCEAMCGNCLTL
jgi:hypothetical protein